MDYVGCRSFIIPFWFPYIKMFVKVQHMFAVGSLLGKEIGKQYRNRTGQMWITV